MSKNRIGVTAFILGLAALGWSGSSPEAGQAMAPYYSADARNRVLSAASPIARPAFGLDGPVEMSPPRLMPDQPQATADSRPASESKEQAPVKRPTTREQTLNALFDRLAKAADPDEATGVASLIEKIWMRSGSDTADLLMARAVLAMSNDRQDIARTLLDKIVLLRPDWAEAWNKRATLRFLSDDDPGSMEDISHALAIEPRHFGALSGLGFILKRNGLEKQALKALRRAAQIYPENTSIRKAVEDLVPEVEGREL